MAGKRAFGSIRKLPSGRFQARYTGLDLAVHRAPRTFAKKAYAEAWLASEDQMISSGTWTPPERRLLQEESAGVTVGEYVEAVIQRRVKRTRRPITQTTADLYRKDWKNRGQKALGGVVLTELTSAAVTKWWDSLGSTPTQDGRCYDLLKSVMAEAVEDEIIDRNPCRVRGAGKPEPKKRGDAVTVEEGKKYLEAVPPQYRLALMTSLWCGLRSGEVRGLRRRDVDLKAGELRIEQAVVLDLILSNGLEPAFEQATVVNPRLVIDRRIRAPLAHAESTFLGRVGDRLLRVAQGEKFVDRVAHRSVAAGTVHDELEPVYTRVVLEGERPVRGLHGLRRLAGRTHPNAVEVAVVLFEVELAHVPVPHGPVEPEAAAHRYRPRLTSTAPILVLDPSAK